MHSHSFTQSIDASLEGSWHDSQIERLRQRLINCQHLIHQRIKHLREHG
jgi:hypothetical protein